LLEELKAKAEELREKALPVLASVRAGDLPTSTGVSFLEVKYQLLLSYIGHILFYLLLKAEGKSVKDHPVMDQLHHIRYELLCSTRKAVVPFGRSDTCRLCLFVLVLACPAAPSLSV
jgi:hypothetical protein